MNCTVRTISRRVFLGSSIAATIYPPVRGQTRKLETLTEWLDASLAERERALGDLLSRVPSLDKSIHAWVEVAPQPLIGRGELSNIPVGVKDVFETKGLATEYGSPIYRGRRGEVDADVVTRLRERGAVVFGKTHTAAFAYRTPPPTRNPRNLEHTPGGSSSGSAAAVAAGMAPLAIGTQTGGSTLRPASYCGITGFKPTYGLLPVDGVLPFAKSLDTLGFFTHSAADMLAFWDAFGMDTGRAEQVPMAAAEPLPDLEAPMAAAYQGALSRLRAAGVPVRSIDIKTMLARLHEAQQTIMFYEGARFHESRFVEHGDRLDDLAALVRKGLTIRDEQYRDAMQFAAECRQTLDTLYDDAPVILVPAATGPAPRGLSYTGNSSMNSPWTTVGAPAISIPMPVGRALPLGLQLTGRRGDDGRVLQTAVRVQTILGTSSSARAVDNANGA